MLFLLLPALAADVVHLSVSDAMAALEAHNPTLARAQAQSDAARGSALVALSGTLPSLSVSGNYTRNNEEASLDLSKLFEILGTVAEMTGQDKPTAPDAMILQPLEAFSGNASVRVPLLVPSTWVSIGAAQHGTEAADATLSATRSSLHGAALQAFWAEAGAEAFVEAQEASVLRARQLVTIAENAVKAGSGTPLSLLQAQTEEARREGDALQAHANLDKARIAIGILLGEEGPVAVEMPATPPAPAPETALADAWATRGEVQAATQQVEVAHRQLLSVQLGALPTVAGTFSVFASSEPYVTGENTGWKGTVDLSWPLLQGGLRAGNEQKARAAVADAEAALEVAKLQVAQQVQNATIDLNVATARLDIAGHQRQLAEEAARVAQRSFEAGAFDSAPVLDALDRLDVAHAAEIDARSRLGMADAALHAAIGRW